MKKIIPALALLLVSAVLLSTASFAWFSMNSTVTATGMEVTVSAPTSLLISITNATTGFAATQALANDNASAAGEFYPVAYSGVCAAWYKLTTDGMADINENGRAITFTEVADGSAAASFTAERVGDNTDDTKPLAYAADSTFFYHDTVWLKVEGEKNQTVTVTAAYTSTVTDKIKDAMHIVFVVNGAVVDTLNMGGTGEKLTSGTLATLTANAAEGTQVDIYYFLSGNDEDCMNKNIAADRELSIDLTFTAADVS